jgi:hypothetical protein
MMTLYLNKKFAVKFTLLQINVHFSTHTQLFRDIWFRITDFAIRLTIPGPDLYLVRRY